MPNYNTNQWLIFNYIIGAGGKFLANCFFQFDAVANWYASNLSKQQRSEIYINLLNNAKESWITTEPDQPWNLNFYSRAWPRGSTTSIEDFNRQVELTASDYFKQCWNNKQVITDFWHKGYRPEFWNQATWITINIDDIELYKKILFSKTYTYDSKSLKVTSWDQSPSTGSLANLENKQKYQNQWQWENVTSIDDFINQEVKQLEWYATWNEHTVYTNTINLTDLFNVDKLYGFITQFEDMFQESIDYNTIKQLQAAWSDATLKRIHEL